MHVCCAAATHLSYMAVFYTRHGRMTREDAIALCKLPAPRARPKISYKSPVKFSSTAHKACKGCGLWRPLSGSSLYSGLNPSGAGFWTFGPPEPHRSPSITAAFSLTRPTVAAFCGTWRRFWIATKCTVLPAPVCCTRFTSGFWNLLMDANKYYPKL